MKIKKYIHNEQAHNLTDPAIIVPVILEVLNPQSVVDVGCGIGTFLNIFKQNGVDDILGLDGPWVDKKLLSKHISLEDFKEVDLEKGFEIDRKFDLALCLEVLEHIQDKFASNVVKSLTLASNYIVFSASIPGQMGQNHVNEQWMEYWIDIFKQYGYSFYDVFRPIFWNNKQVSRWYKQNMFLVVKNGKENIVSGFEKFFDKKILNYVHPEYYTLRLQELAVLYDSNNKLSNQIQELLKGSASLITYLKLLVKYFLIRFKIYKQ